MRKRTIALIAILTALLAACTETTGYNTTLVQADSLMASHPDSALHMLQGIPAESLKTKADRAYHALLLTQARDKNYIVQTDDSLIRIAVRYYDSMRDSKMQARAYYYWGSVYRDRNEQAIATEKFLIAIPFAQEAGDKALLGRIYNNVGYLYCLQGLYNKADSIFQQAEKIAVWLNDTILQVEALTMQGKICFKQKDYPQAEKKLLQAQQATSGNFRQNRLRAAISNALSLLYSRTKEKEKALHYAKQNISLQEDTIHCYHAFLTLGEAYFKTEKYDSAAYCFNRSLGSSDYGIKADACMRLADIANRRGDTSVSLKMEQMHLAYRDSLEQASQRTKLLETEQRITIRKQQARYESSLNRYSLAAIVSAAICIVISLLLINYRFRHRRQERQQLERENELRRKYVQQRGELEQKEKEIAASQDRIARQHINEKQKQMLEAELAGLNEQHTALVKKMRKYSEVIQKIDRILSVYKENKIPKEFLDENDWARLLAEVDPRGVVNGISEKCRLSEIECHLCGLLLLEYSVADMGRIIQRQRISVYRIERTITKKMGRDYQAGELQKWLKSMVNDSMKQENVTCNT
ncbi:hypothetical protein [uncultured Bacteroides sp.]|uniref:tetratricopeptide repeat protein n=1 Tax=uncultured Bacteroides sp. TaxID=162156 RepID=UPI00259AABA9|nr:hypothetical protein [uncultured Bacteroides sp.]